MLDFADAVAINKFERRGADDALRDVGRQLVRNREAFGAAWQDMPVFGTSAATFDDDGVTALYHHLRDLLAEGRPRRRRGPPDAPGGKDVHPARRGAARRTACATSRRSPRPCAATTPRPQRWAELARRRQHLRTAREVVGEPVAAALEEAERALAGRRRELLDTWPGRSRSTRATSWSCRSATASCARR